METAVSNLKKIDLGLASFEASADGALLMIAPSTSAALAWTLGEDCIMFRDQKFHHCNIYY